MESFWIRNKINYRRLRPFLAQLIIESPNLGFPQKMQERGIIEINDKNAKCAEEFFPIFFREPAAVGTRACCNVNFFSIILSVTINQRSLKKHSGIDVRILLDSFTKIKSGGLQVWRLPSAIIKGYDSQWFLWVLNQTLGVHGTPQIIHFNRVWNHYFHHPFWGTPIFGSTPLFIKP